MLLLHQQKDALPYVYAYLGNNIDDKTHSLALSYPEIQTYYGLVSGLLFNLPYSLIGIFAGILCDKLTDVR
jgi:hypothetical protein